MAVKRSTLMSGSFLLDTNIVIALLANEKLVLEKLAKAERVFMPSIVLGELIFGAYKSRRADENLARVDELAAGSAILNCDASTGRYYGKIKNNLRLKGRPIPENDIWIAAIAQQYGLTLISRDVHFSEVDDLLLEVW